MGLTLLPLPSVLSMLAAHSLASRCWAGPLQAHHLASPRINIISLEDPIEMVHEKFNQIAMQPKIGLDFASALRTVLRQDPDVIMVGEIRDTDTAQNVVQAAMTGHMVLSTIHTGDASGAIGRMLDLGVMPFLLSGVLNGILAGLVAVSASFCLVLPWHALITGFVGGIFYNCGRKLLWYLHVDDPCDAISVHLFVVAYRSPLPKYLSVACWRHPVKCTCTRFLVSS